jgi:hypothetical protein
MNGKCEEKACAIGAGVDFVEEYGNAFVMSCRVEAKPVESSCHAILDNLAGAHTCCLRISWMHCLYSK